MIKLFHIKILFCLLLVWQRASAQSYCIPRSNCQSGDIINNFKFGAIENLNSGGSNCGNSQGNSYSLTSYNITFVQGFEYNFEIQSGSQFGQVFGIWMDWNGDGDFEDPNEFVFSTENTTTSKITGNLTINPSSNLGKIRMRVRSRFSQRMNSSEACQTFFFGETEDYEFEIVPDTMPPVVSFSSFTAASCGPIQFKDESLNRPIDWFWDFGDGNTSTAQNPVHIYQAPGIYDVKLRASNQNGSDSTTKVDFVQISSLAINGASCLPQTINQLNLSNTGIKKVEFGQLSYESDDARNEGYQDNSCMLAIIKPGQILDLRVESFDFLEHDIEVWIDWNGDGVFQVNNELVAYSNRTTILKEEIIIPVLANVNSIIRMRIIAEPTVNGINSPCANLQSGQVEDYGLWVQENTSAPKVGFSAEKTISCNGEVFFLNKTQNLPNSFIWDFGDGNVSFGQNPTHTYNQSGTYDVSLIASNNFGSDTLQIKNHVNITLQNNLPSTCMPQTANHISDYGIYEVNIGNYINKSPGGEKGYEDYSCSRVFFLERMTDYPIEIITGTQNPEDLNIWIDLNSDGNFDNSEIVMSSKNKFVHNGNLFFHDTFPLTGVNLRMRIFADAAGNISGPCANSLHSQVEDYGIVILDDAPRARFGVDANVVCDGRVRFRNQSRGATNYVWDFGDGNISNLFEPQHQYQNPGVYTVTLFADNGRQTNKMTYQEHILYRTTNCNFATFTNNLVANHFNCDGEIEFNNSVQSSNYFESSMRISPPGAGDVRLNISSFNLPPSDTLFIHNGPIKEAPLVGAFSGSSIPMGGARLFDSGAIYLRYKSTDSLAPKSFKAFWRCWNYLRAPTPFFEVDSQNTCSGKVKFEDYSTGRPTQWEWRFKAGEQSNQQDPVYSFDAQGKYTVNLKVSNDRGWNETSIDIFKNNTFCHAVGITNTELSTTSIKLYPNPSNTDIYIDLPADNDVFGIRILDLQGKLLHFDNFYNGNAINLRHLSNGMYIVQVFSNNVTYQLKLLKY